MKTNRVTLSKYKFLLQCLAFVLIVTTSAGFYFSVTSGLSWLTWFLMALLSAAMLLVVWVT